MVICPWHAGNMPQEAQPLNFDNILPYRLIPSKVEDTALENVGRWFQLFHSNCSSSQSFGAVKKDPYQRTS